MKYLAILFLMLASPAWAQQGGYSDCSGTVGGSSTAVTFPSSGNTGPTAPQRYLIIINPAGTNKLAVNINAAAAIDSSGSYPLDSAGSSWSWSAATGNPPPATINIIASAGSTPYTCKYN